MLDSLFPSCSLAGALLADRPAPDRAERMGLYGQFVGRWTMSARISREDGSLFTGEGTIAFGWVLEGRAVQDVWVLPSVFHGTTLRVYDPGLEAWHILWSDPVRQVHMRQLGRARGQDIVQEGRAEDGTPTRWTFTDITPDSFTWRGERARADGGWWLQTEFRARRLAG